MLQVLFLRMPPSRLPISLCPSSGAWSCDTELVKRTSGPSPHRLRPRPTEPAPPLPFQVWLFHQKPESLNPLTKYLSATTGFGSNYVTTEKVGLPLSGEAAAVSCWPASSPPVPRGVRVVPVTPFPVPFQMDLDDDTAEKFYWRLLELERRLRATVLSTD